MLLGAECWTLNKELGDDIEAFEMHCYRKSVKIPHIEYVTKVTRLETLKLIRQNTAIYLDVLKWVSQTEIIRYYIISFQSSLEKNTNVRSETPREVRRNSDTTKWSVVSGQVSVPKPIILTDDCVSCRLSNEYEL